MQRIGVWDVTERTRENYATVAKMLAPIADMRLQRVRTLDVEAWHTALRARGLAPSTIRAAHRLLVRALADAVHHKLAIANPAREQSPPRAPGRKVVVPTEGDVAPMLERLRGDQFYVPVLVTLLTAVRRGELLAAAWRHVDLVAGMLTIERALDEAAAGGVTFKRPKTESGERVISLPAAAVTALRDHWRQQAEMRLALGLGRPSDNDLVFGSLRWPAAVAERVQRGLDQDCEAARLTQATWNGLRHLSASLLLRHGVDLATASRRLGHSRPDTTARLYLHSVTKDDRHAAVAMEKALGDRR